MDKLVLYNYFRSSTSFRVRIGLEIKKLNYEYQPIHLLADGGQQNQPAYRKLNPMGGVPTLVHQDKVLSQSLVILQYLDAVFPDSYKLFPEEPFARAKVLQFCEMINADMHAFANLKVLKYLEENHNYQQDQKDAWVNYWFTQGFTAIEKTLEISSKDFCFGSQLSAADLLLVPMATTAERFKMKIEHFPHVNRIYKSCLLRPEFMKAHPFRQIDTPVEMRLP